MLYELFKRTNIPYKDSGTNVGREFINICCPFCNESRFHCGINTIDYWFKCFVCGESGSWYKLKKQVKRDFPEINWDGINPPKRVFHTPLYEKQKPENVEFPFLTPLEKHSLCFEWLTTKPHLDLLYNKFRPRGLPKNILDYVEIFRGSKKFNGYVVFKEGQNISGRKYNPKAMGARWKKNVVSTPFIYGEIVSKRFSMPVGVITEGIFDMLRIPQGNAVALSGTSMSNSVLAKILSIFKNAGKIILALDRGVKEKSIQDFYLALSDMYIVDVVNWDNIKDTKIKDLDELALVYGNKYMLDFVGLTREELI